MVFLLAVLAGAYYAGSFSQRIDTSLCFSSVIDIIKEEYSAAQQAKDESATARFSELLTSLPIRGYESDCAEILEVAREHAKQNK